MDRTIDSFFDRRYFWESFVIINDIFSIFERASGQTEKTELTIDCNKAVKEYP
jgi:hypothetical protein